MRLYFRYLGVLLKSQLQYRASFLLLAIGQFFLPFTVFAGLAILFERFGRLPGWSFAEAALCFGVIHMAFAIGECFARGFDTFSQLVVRGDFDRMLVRPRSTFLQVLGSNFEFSRVGRLLQGLVALGWATWHLDVGWTPFRALVLLLMVACGAVLFAGIYVLAATLCFWTVQGLEIANIFTDGGREMAQYPMNIYEKWAARFFTYVIPFGCINYWPLLYVLDRTDGGPAALYALSPLAGALFLLPCLLVWRFGVRRYRSTGS